jgi:hypothetical protein
MKEKVMMATATIPANLVDAIAGEMAVGIDRAVECWMSQVERALTDVQLTSLGRLHAARQVIEKYKTLTDKDQLQGRSA